MRSSLIINTACMAPHAQQTHNPFRSTSYAERAESLAALIDNGVVDATEVIVAGNYKPDSNDPSTYIYADVPPVYMDRRDALVQREMGARLSTGELLIFTHDDHMPDFNVTEIPEGDWDILVPKRIHRETGEELSNGQNEDYMGGHTLIMKRDAWVRVPWLAVLPERCWDLFMTRIWREAGLKIEWTDAIQCLDLEAKAGER